MATTTGREESLRHAVRSLLPQVDELRIYLNRYSAVPAWLELPKVRAVRGPHCGDVGKFYCCEDADGYLFTVDDDIIYPPDYVRRMVEAIESLGRCACVGVHGAVLTRHPVTDYYRDRRVLHFREGLRAPVSVHVLGTGTLAWHSSTLEVRQTDFPVPNMADVWFALRAQASKVPMVCVSRPVGWLQDAPGVDLDQSIWGSRTTASAQTQAVNGWRHWHLFPVTTGRDVAVGSSTAESRRTACSGEGAGPCFVVLSTGRNVAGLVDRMVASVASQRGPHWRMIYVDDASTDGSARRVLEVARRNGIPDRVQVVDRQTRHHKTRNVVEVVRAEVGDDEVVVMLDADDWLASDRALEKLAEEYRRGWEVVWANWRGSDGTLGTSWHLNPFLPPRRQPWVSSHLFSFRAHLLKGTPDAEFQDDQGHWFRAACDQAIALPVLDSTIRRRHIPDVLCTYNRDNPLSHDRQGQAVNPLVSQAQATASGILYARPPREPAWDPAFGRSHRFELTEAALASARRFGGAPMIRFVQQRLAETLDGHAETCSVIGADSPT